MTKSKQAPSPLGARREASPLGHSLAAGAAAGSFTPYSLVHRFQGGVPSTLVSITISQLRELLQVS